MEFINFMCKRHIVRTFLFISIFFPVVAGAQQITDEAQRIYQQSHQAVVQIQLIDLATGKKTSIGSGFQFSAQGHTATNFHVVSEAVHAPQRFRIECVRHDGAISVVELLDIDVIHDLAVLQSPNPFDGHLDLGDSAMSKGTRIFSMGNPFDLGMTIVEGIYNGLMEDSLYQKILFSGSINPGMSGGPALDHEGKVIGINVATAGDQVSFLVPVEYLKDLAVGARTPGGSAEDWKARIGGQLLANQDRYMQMLLQPQWDVLDIGGAKVPGEILNVFKCWGKSEDKESELYNYAYINCATNDKIFISSEFSTGQILYKYYWMTSKGLNAIRFYNLYEHYFRYPNPYDNAGEDDVTNFQCDNDFVDVGGRGMKVLWCARNYKTFPGLYDINLSMALVDVMDRGLLVEVVAMGVSEKNAVEFVRKFMKEIRWQNLSSK